MQIYKTLFQASPNKYVQQFPMRQGVTDRGYQCSQKLLRPQLHLVMFQTMKHKWNQSNEETIGLLGERFWKPSD